MKKAECLIIIGYGGRDIGINQNIVDYYDYRNKPSFIVDPYYSTNKDLKRFGDMIGAQAIEKSIENIEEIKWKKL